MKTKHLFTYDVRPGHLFNIPDCPDNVMFDLTWKCNFRCSFCYNPRENRKLGDPPWEVTQAILRKLAEWGVREVLYLGGEPMLHPKFDAVIELGARLGLAQRVVTNGSRITENRADLLAKHDVEVGVSLHSSNADIHNHLTGSRQGFQMAIKGLSLLINAGVRSFVQYSPTRSDADGLPGLAEFLRTCYDTAIRFIDVNRLLPFGEAAQDEKQVLLDPDGCWRVLKSVGELGSMDWTIKVEAFAHCWVYKQAASEHLQEDIIRSIISSLRPCYMGINQLALDPAGRIKPCPGGRATGPNLIECMPNRCWQEQSELMTRRSLSFLPKSCIDYIASKTCVHFFECLGGCRSASGGSSAQSDPLTGLSRTTGRPV